jgi:acyl dehydratase
MAASIRHVLRQGPMLATLGQTAVTAIIQSLDKNALNKPALVAPTPEVVRVFPPHANDLLDDYIRHVGGDAKAYAKTVPPHFFPQWAMPVAAATLKDAPYPMTRVLNGGCRMEMRAPIPRGEKLTVRACLSAVDDNGQRALLTQRIITSSESVPDALIAEIYAYVPLKRAEGGQGGKAGKEKPRVPEDAHETARYRLSATAGLDFAKLTGDFNPIHWIPAAAKASGFKNVILHGFGTLARAYEGVVRGTFSGDIKKLSVFDVKFTRPLVLPHEVGLYVHDHNVFVGDAAGGPAYMQGRFETR